MYECIADLRFGVRMLRRNPAFTATALLTLALGIGAATAIFNVADEALLSPLPLPEPQQLVAVYSFDKKTSHYISTSYPDFEDLSKQNRSFQQFSAYVRLPLNLIVGDSTERISVEAVSGNYFSMLELPPFLGRTFAAEEAPAVMLSEELWRQRFGGDDSLIGKTVTLEGSHLTVIGIVPARYRGVNLNWGDPPQAWIPFSAVPLVLPRFEQRHIFHLRSARWLVMFGRLRAGVSVSQAEADLRRIAGNLAQTEPATNRDVTVAAFSAARSKFWPAYRSSVTQLLVAFSASAALLLLLACANVSNLLLERAVARRREMAVRIALGARRAALIRQLLSESFLLVVGSFSAALLIAVILARVLSGFPGAFGLPLALHPSIGSRVLLFCAAASLITIVLFGLVPALQASRPDLVPALKETGNNPSRGDRGDWLRHFLVVAQVGFSMALLVVGGIFTRSLLKAYSVDLGFHPDQLLIMGFDPSTQTDTWQGEQDALRQTLTLPGVQTATVAWDVPLTTMQSTLRVTDAESRSPEPLQVAYNMVGPDYFHTLGITILAGRDFTWADREDSPKIAIANQTLAARLWPGASPLGRTLLVESQPGRQNTVQVVGLARDSKYVSVWEHAQPYVYFAAWQWHWPITNLIARPRVAPQELRHEIEHRWQESFPGMPLYGVHTGQEHVKMSLAPQRLAAALIASFAILAAIVTSIGLYGVVAYSVARRKREIGIRMALGADRAKVVQLVLRGAFKRVMIGLVLGLPLAIGAGRLISAQLYGVTSWDPLALTVAASALALCAFFATIIPASRAASISPMNALRIE